MTSASPKIPTHRLIGYIGLLLGTLAYSGHTYMVDEKIVFEVTRSIVEDGDVIFDAPIHMAVPNRAGQTVSPFAPAPSLLGIPLYIIGKSAARMSGVEPHRVFELTVACAMLVNVFLYGIGMTLTARLAKHWGATERDAFLVALALGLGSFWWIYSQTFYRQVAAGVCTLWVFERIAAYRRHPDIRGVHLTGLAIACLLQCRLDGALMTPIATIGLLWQNNARWPSFPNAKEHLKTIGILSLWTTIGCAGILAHNVAREGNPFVFSMQDIHFTYPIIVSLPKYFFTVRLSVFLNSPPLLLTPIALYALWKNRQGDAALVLAMTLFYLLLYARWDKWDGGLCWGPRLTLVQTPVWIATLGAWLANRAPWKRWTVIALTAIGMPIQILGILLDQSDFHDLATLPGWKISDLHDVWWVTAWPEIPVAAGLMVGATVLMLLIVFLMLRHGLRVLESSDHGNPDNCGSRNHT